MPVEQLGVLGAAYAVPEPLRAEAVQALADVLGAAQLAAVRHQQQPGALGDPERAGEVARAAAPLVVGQPEADDAATGVLPGEPGERARVERVAGAVGRDHDRDAEPGALGGVADAVEHQVGELGDPAEPGGVAAGVDLDLQPPPAVAHVVLGRLEHETAYVVGRAQHRARHVVEALEAEPALLVGRAQLRRPVLDQRVGQHDPVALGELEERRVAHRPGEVEVEVGLRQRRHVAVPPDPICHAPSLPRLGSTALAPSPYASRLVDPPDASACPATGSGPSEGTSSTGRASVSKTEGWGFKSLVPCEKHCTATTRRWKTWPTATRFRTGATRAATTVGAPAPSRSCARWWPSSARWCGPPSSS